MTWRDDAACRDADPADFDSADPRAHKLARMVCAGCTVAVECWADAERQLRSQHYTPQGAWGGRLLGKRSELRRLGDEP